MAISILRSSIGNTMSSDHPIVYTTSSRSEAGNVARFGFIEAERGNRMVVYTTEQLHPQEVVNGSDNKETMFYKNYAGQIQPISGDVEETTLNVVRALAEYTPVPFNEHIGIRISMSDIPEYVSKIVIRMGSPRHVDAMLTDIAYMLYERVAEVRSNLVYERERSTAEKRDYDVYNLLDW